MIPPVVYELVAEDYSGGVATPEEIFRILFSERELAEIHALRHYRKLTKNPRNKIPWSKMGPNIWDSGDLLCVGYTIERRKVITCVKH